MAGGSTSALSLSGPAQASLALRPVESLSRPEATFVARLQRSQLPSQAARQLPDPIDNCQTCGNDRRSVYCLGTSPGNMRAIEVDTVTVDHGAMDTSGARSGITRGAIARDAFAVWRAIGSI